MPTYYLPARHRVASKGGTIGFASSPDGVTTDRSGRAVFAMPHNGTWLLNVIWTKPQPKTAETDYGTVFSSLSFGFPSYPSPPAQ
jgi:hypothetical protein